MRILLHMKKDDPEAIGFIPLDIENLSDFQIQKIVYDLKNMILSFDIIPLRDWGLSIRAENVLRANQLVSLNDVATIPKAKIIRLARCGVKTNLEIYQAGRLNGVELLEWLGAVNDKYQRGFLAKKDSL